MCCVLCPTLVLCLHIFLLLSPFKAGSSAGGKERGTWSGEGKRGVVIVIVPSSNGPICPPCRSCPGCTRAASCRLTHGPGQTDIQTKCQDASTQPSTSECPFLSSPFLSIFMSFHSIFSPYGPTIDSLSAPPICETEFAIVCKSRASMQRLTVQPHSPS